jgi:multidrug efflux pump subunit AcrA (membrane-fusion protein)
MMMHIGLMPFAVAWNLSANVTALQNSSRIGALIKKPTTKASETKPPTKGKKSLIQWVAKTTSELLLDDNQVVKQAPPIAKPDSRDYQVALAQAKAGFEQAKAQLAQSQGQLIQADAQLKQVQARGRRRGKRKNITLNNPSLNELSTLRNRKERRSEGVRTRSFPACL